MKIAVISDTHGNTDRLLGLCDVFNECNALFFLGDGERDLTALNGHIDVPIYAVCGNNDFSSQLPSEYTVDLYGTKFFLTHGHKYGVNDNLSLLSVRAQAEECLFALYGHTHIPYLESDGKVILMNPGSLGYPFAKATSYGIIENEGGRLNGKIIYI